MTSEPLTTYNADYTRTTIQLSHGDVIRAVVSYLGEQGFTIGEGERGIWYPDLNCSGPSSRVLTFVVNKDYEAVSTEGLIKRKE